MDKENIPALILEILKARGFETEEEMRSFLFSGISSLSDPFTIPRLKEACETLLEAMSQEKKIFVYGDGDVDGICSAFLLLAFMNGQGMKTPFYLTHRLDENYEMETAFIDELKKNGYSILITVDCGISSLEAMRKAEESGIKCIILDHHIGDNRKNLPASHIYVNPYTDKWDANVSCLSGAGIAFKFVAGMEQLMPSCKGKKVSDLFEIPCLASLADFVPLKGENRIFVKEGIRRLPFTSIKGLQFIQDYYGLKPPLTTRDIIMKLNPKLNSPGRLGKPEVVLELFLENDSAVISKLIDEIDRMDKERYRAVSKIMKQIESTEDSSRGFILSGDNCKGLSGIIASRLSEKYNRPFMVCYEKNETVRGSIRTPDGYYLNNVKSEIEKYMDEMGGHRHAVGFKCSSVNVDKVREAWDSVEWKADEIMAYDCELDIDRLNPVIIGEMFRYLEPFGKGNPMPIFLCRDVFIKNIRNGSQKRFWVKKEASFFEAVMANGLDIPQGKEKTDVYYTPCLREAGGLYRIFLRISGVENQ
ncbi:MAG TPA: DHH family phosphoesterase [bacterium]|nr:DHH family phosphoesterase [bacterium]